MSVVADTRLNRLIAQGSASEVEQVEAYLKIIDRSNGLRGYQNVWTIARDRIGEHQGCGNGGCDSRGVRRRVVASTTGQTGQPGQQPGQPRAPQKPDPREADSKPKKGGCSSEINDRPEILNLK